MLAFTTYAQAKESLPKGSAIFNFFTFRNTSPFVGRHKEKDKTKDKLL